MNLFGHQVSLFVVDLAIIGLSLLTLVVIHAGLHMWQKRALGVVHKQVQEIQKIRAESDTQAQDAQKKAASGASKAGGWFLLGTLAGGPLLGALAAGVFGGPDLYSSGKSSQQAENLTARADALAAQANAEVTRISRRLTILNLIGNTLVAIPLVGAIVALVVGDLHLAFRFDIWGLILVGLRWIGGTIVTYLVLPALKAALAKLATDAGNAAATKVEHGVAKLATH